MELGFSVETWRTELQWTQTWHRLWKSKEQLMVDALVDHCDQIVVVPHTGSMRTDLAGHLASLAKYFNTAIEQSAADLLSGQELGLASVRSYF